MTGIIASMGLKAIAGTAIAKTKAGYAAIPPKVKLAIVGIIAAIFLIWLHQHVAHKRLKAQYDAGYTQRGLDDAEAARKEKAKLDAATTWISELERTKNVEAHKRVDRDADAVLLRGPGLATCRGGSSAPSPALRRPSAATDVTVDGQVDRLPDTGGVDLIALPFPDAVAFAREHDACEVDRASWENLYRELQKVWPKQP